MGKKIDLTGQRFGRLVVVEEAFKQKGEARRWLCVCDCGNDKVILQMNLRYGRTQSCGCLQKEKIHNTNKKFSYSSFIRKNNTSGYTGVSFDNKNKKWDSRITVNKKIILLGQFKHIEDAINARKEAEEKYFQPILDKYGKESN